MYIVPEINGEDGVSLDLYTDNMGEPYRDGISIGLKTGRQRIYAFLERREVVEMRDALNEILGGNV